MKTIRLFLVRKNLWILPEAWYYFQDVDMRDILYDVHPNYQLYNNFPKHQHIYHVVCKDMDMDMDMDAGMGMDEDDDVGDDKDCGVGDDLDSD